MILIIPLFSISVITIVNPILSVLSLISLSTILSVVLFQISLNFISLLYILVYVGAVAILFIFVLITIDIREEEIVELNKSYTKHLPLVFFLFWLSFFIINYLIDDSLINLNNLGFQNTLETICIALYGFNSLNLLITSLILLSAIIGPIYICLKIN